MIMSFKNKWLNNAVGSDVKCDVIAWLVIEMAWVLERITNPECSRKLRSQNATWSETDSSDTIGRLARGAGKCRGVCIKGGGPL